MIHGRTADKLNFHCVRGNLRRRSRQAIDCKKILTKDTSDKGLIQNIQRTLKHWAKGLTDTIVKIQR